jgi:hypothetical protein
MSSLTKKLLVLRGLTDDRHTVFKFSEPAGTPRAVLFGAVVGRSFLENAKGILGAQGVPVMNVVAAIEDAKRYVETIRQVFGEAIVIAMRRDGNLVVFAGNSLHNPKHVRLAVRNAERAEDRLGLFFPTLIRCLNEIAHRWICGVRHVLK